MGKYLWPILVSILLVSVTAPAQAQYRGMGYAYRHWWYESPAENVARSHWYDHLLEVNLGFRHYRMRKECLPIVDDPALRQDCFASFAQYEPVAPYAGWYGNPGWRGWHHRWHHRWHRRWHRRYR